ncbi:MAG: hypothetical protein IH626_13160 [Rhodospirillales bacterium]|nr:hypothetical protein [Rhodospirillales bacterium]
MHAFTPPPTPISIRRRTLLVSVLAATAVSALPRIAWSSTAGVLPGETADRQFSVLYKGDRIGAHVVHHFAATGQTRVTTDIDLVVKALFFTVYAFSHHSEEIWQDGRLMSLSSRTMEHGETIDVEGVAVPHGFRVVSRAGPYLAARGALTSNSLWTPAVLQQDTLIDAQYGGVIGVSVSKLADEQIVLAGQPLRTARYRFITPYIAGSIWYDDGGRWVQGEFERDGAQIHYRLDA